MGEYDWLFNNDLNPGQTIVQCTEKDVIKKLTSDEIEKFKINQSTNKYNL